MFELYATLNTLLDAILFCYAFDDLFMYPAIYWLFRLEDTMADVALRIQAVRAIYVLYLTYRVISAHLEEFDS